MDAVPESLPQGVPAADVPRALRLHQEKPPVPTKPPTVLKRAAGGGITWGLPRVFSGYTAQVDTGIGGNAHKTLRQTLLEDQKLDSVISLPGGVLKPYAGVSTAILVFTKTNSGGTNFVWFYDVEADGWSLDDKRTPLLSEEKLGAIPKVALSADERPKNNLPDILARWHRRDGEERKRPRTAQSFCVPKSQLVENGYDLSLNRYKEVVHPEVNHLPPHEILANLARLEEEIQQGIKELGAMLK